MEGICKSDIKVGLRNDVTTQKDEGVLRKDSYLI